jgi:two-component system, OmpR family, response regulator
MEKKNAPKALIIDDEIDICFLLSNILQRINLHVTFVNTLEEGKNELLKNKPDLLFLDNHLKDGYGIDFIEYVKKKHAGIKVIMVTAHDTSEDRKKALQYGADVFVAKPFSAADIKAAIQKTIS